MFDVECKFHVADDSPLRDAGHALEFLRPYARWLGERDPSLAHWWLGGESREEAQRHEAFVDGVDGHQAALAVVRREYRRSREPAVFLWNGQDDGKAGASLSISIAEGRYPSDISLELDGSAASPRPALAGYAAVADFVAMLARDTDARCCYVYRVSAYGRRMTYLDRPGVGWMLYLPRVFTPAEVPEARAMVPVEKDGRQIGTVIVSVTDAVFSAKNDEHLRVAREIETRLVANDWLPTWAQMMRPA